MTIAHHPPETMLAGFAAGTLDHGQHIAIATHLVVCPKCRAFQQVVEEVGGAMVESLPPAPMSRGAFAKIAARLGEPARPAAAAVARTNVETNMPGMPGFLRRYKFGNWR